jgi:hypothetical protein
VIGGNSPGFVTAGAVRALLELAASEVKIAEIETVERRRQIEYV